MHAKRAAASFAALLALTPGFACAESGTLEMLTSAVQVLQSIQLGDTTVVGSHGTGTVTILKSSGEPFTVGSSATVKCVRMSKKTPTSFELEADCVATFSTADSIGLIFKRRSGDVTAGTSGEGTQEITSGTGKFSGLSGNCKYQVTTLAGDGAWNVTHSQCRWQR